MIFIYVFGFTTNKSSIVRSSLIPPIIYRLIGSPFLCISYLLLWVCICLLEFGMPLCWFSCDYVVLTLLLDQYSYYVISWSFITILNTYLHPTEDIPSMFLVPHTFFLVPVTNNISMLFLLISLIISAAFKIGNCMYLYKFFTLYFLVYFFIEF